GAHETRRLWALFGPGPHRGGGGAGLHPYERRLGHDANQGDSAAHDQLRRQLAIEHDGEPGNADERERARRIMTMTDAPPLRDLRQSTSVRRFLMAGGGTGGHVIPAIAVAQELKNRGHQVFFVGTERGMENRLVPAAGFELRHIEIGALNRVAMT